MDAPRIDPPATPALIARGRRLAAAADALASGRRLPWVVLTVGVLIALLSWPIGSLSTSTGLDPSWQAAVNVAWQQGTSWGGDLVFAYGPLGLLTWPALWFGDTLVLSVGYVFLQVVLLAGALLLAARRGLGILGAAAATYAVLAAGFVPPPEAGGVLAAVLAVVVLLRPPPPRLVPLVLAGAGILAALQLLVKFTGGVVAVAAAVAVAAGIARGARDWAVGAGTFLGGLLLAWLALGQSLADLPAWLRGSAQIASGFTEAMWLQSHDGRPAWDVATCLVLGGSLVWLAVRAGTDLPRRPRIALTAVVTLAAFVAFKAAFVRHDLAHAPIYAGAVACYALALCARPRLRAHALLTAGAALLLVTAYTATDWAGRLDPRDRLVAMKDQVGLVVRPSERSRATADARAAARTELAIPASMTQDLAGGAKTVNVDPVTLSAIWAYGWRWAPVPTLQRYAGYTPYLDDRNADRLRSPEAPEVILREAGGAIDGRLPAHESPSAFLALLCGYRQSAVDGRWQRLDRIPDRCGTPVEISRVSVRSGEAVPVPPGGPGDIVFARFEASRGLVDRFRALVYRPSTVPTLTLNGLPARFVVTTAGQDHVLRVPSLSGWAPEFDGGLRVDTLAVNGLGTVGIRFFRVPVGG